MTYRITVLPAQVNIPADGGDLLSALRAAGLGPDAPCGGNGRCGKCTVLLDGRPVPACRVTVDRNMTVTIPQQSSLQILTEGVSLWEGSSTVRGPALAFDIGTTTVAGYLLDAQGQEVTSQSCLNPQQIYGADVISRIRLALKGELAAMSACIRSCVSDMSRSLCEAGGVNPEDIQTVSIVGNPAMQQLYLGINPENLATVPYSPVLTQYEITAAQPYLPCCPNAALLIVPDIGGFVGADTAACILATGMSEQEETTLLVDIGTNGEMVLGNRHRLVACSTAAGPALEGAGIRWGMRGSTGAIDHVWLEDQQLRCSVIGGGEAIGICGSGLIDAAAAALELGLLNSRGKILSEERTIPLQGEICLTQEDIRQLQLAKGAIAAGIRLMARQLGISPGNIDRVYLAGAFGTFLNPRSACKIGLLPPELDGKIRSVGNAAGSGAKILAAGEDALAQVQRIVDRTEFLELASLPDFNRYFAESMRFPHG